ncbi:MAG TPA: glycosyltransferase family 1 protein [Longimicrobiales bacterium]|nr:glycosyltransferase family 1 protein [Longimicrobiales bacterium]
MRIAFFTESLLPLVDGVSHTLGHLFAALEEEGIDFRVYAPFVPPPEIPWQHRTRKVRSFTFPLYRDYRVSLPGGRRIAAELDAWEPDIVHVVSPTPMAIWAQAYARARGIPVVATFHTHFVAYFPYYRVGRLERMGWGILRWFYCRCTATFAPSTSIIEELNEHGITNVRLWSRGVDSRRFAPEWRDAALRARLGADARTPLVLLVSRLVKEKDMADFVAMDRELRARNVPYRLALVGDGPMRKRLEHDLPHAHFAGHQSGPDLSRWYASADIFVFPSTTETFANVVQESMASGVPAVVSDRGGPQSVIENERSGLVARANDPVDFADKVERLVADHELRTAMGRAARQRALERSWAAVNSVLLCEYGRIAGSRPEPVRRWA